MLTLVATNFDCLLLYTREIGHDIFLGHMEEKKTLLSEHRQRTTKQIPFISSITSQLKTTIICETQKAREMEKM
jgi:hypothetical protein